MSHNASDLSEQEQAYKKLSQAITDNNYQGIVAVLRNPNFDINYFPQDGKSYLEQAKEESNEVIETLLFNIGANVRATNSSKPNASQSSATKSGDTSQSFVNHLTNGARNKYKTNISFIERYQTHHPAARQEHPKEEQPTINPMSSDQTHLQAVLRSKSFDMLTSFLSENTINLSKDIKFDPKDPWHSTVNSVLQLAKQKQQDMLNAYNDAQGQPSCLEKMESIKEKFEMDVHMLIAEYQIKYSSPETSLPFNTFIEINQTLPENPSTVDKRIHALITHGSNLIQNDDPKLKEEGMQTLRFANLLKQALVAKQEHKHSPRLTALMNRGNEILGKNTTTSNILFHLALALTVVGLIPITYNKYKTGSFLMTHTKGQNLVNTLDQDISHMNKLR